MKFITKVCSLALGAITTWSLAAGAENKVYIEDFTIDNYEVKTVPVIIENDEVTSNVQVDIILPDNLEMAGTNPVNVDAFATPGVTFAPQQLVYRSKDKLWRLGLVNFDTTKGFEAGTRTIIELNVRAKEGALDTNSTANIGVFAILGGTRNESGVTNSYYRGTINTTVTLNAATVEKTVSMYCSSDQPVVINPADTRSFTVAMTNNSQCAGLQFDIELPEGLSYDHYELCDRVNPGVLVRPTKLNSKNAWRFAVVILSTTEDAINGNEGDIFKIFVTANDTFNGEAVQGKISNIVLSGRDAQPVNGQDATFSIISGQTAMEQAYAEIERLNQELTEAMNFVNENYPFAAETISPMSVYNLISSLSTAIDTAYENYTLTPNYTDVMAPVSDIEAAIAKYKEDARAAQEAETARQSANQTAYNAAVAAIDALQTSLNDTKNSIATDYAEYADAEAEAAVQTMIDNARTAAQKAFEEVAAAGEFSYTVPEEEISAAIAALLTSAQAKKAEADRKAANQAAYDADLAKITALQNKLNETEATIAADYAGFGDEAAEKAAQEMIDAAKSAAEAALAAVVAEGTYKNTVPEETINAAIDALLTAAKEKKAAEEARVAANKAAYDADLAKITAHQNKLDETKATIASDYAGYGDEEAEAAVQEMIDSAKSAADAAFAAVATEGSYENTVPEETINAAIDALLTAAKVKKEGEESRVAANKAAYDADIAKVDALQAALDAAKAEVRKDYPDYTDTVAEDAIQNQINDLRAAIAAAFAAVADEGLYKYDMQDAAISEAIAEIVPAAAERERVAFNDAAHTKDLADIDELITEYNNALDQIRQLNPEYADSEDCTSVGENLRNARTAIEDAYTAVATEGRYETPVDFIDLAKQIETMSENVPTGISNILNDVDIRDVEIYTMDGMRHNNLVKGQINIVKFKDNSIRKVIVK